MEAKAFAIADNNLTRQAVTDDALLAQYLQEIAAQSQPMFEATGFDSKTLDLLLQGLSDADRPDDDDEIEWIDPEQSDGSLLALTEVTIGEPRHAVARGDVWELDHHILICADVLTGWSIWKPFLKGSQTVFAPYPGPFVPLTQKADTLRFVMVQPDGYVAGHILDRYADIKGANHVRKRD
jgi:hypothetical protein